MRRAMEHGERMTKQPEKRDIETRLLEVDLGNFRIGDFDNARAAYKAMIEEEGADLANLGIAYRQLGRTDDARRSWEEALRIFTEIKSPHAGTVRGWLAGLGQGG